LAYKCVHNKWTTLYGKICVHAESGLRIVSFFTNFLDEAIIVCRQISVDTFVVGKLWSFQGSCVGYRAVLHRGSRASAPDVHNNNNNNNVEFNVRFGVQSRHRGRGRQI